METEAEYIVTSQSDSKMPMHAYIVMLHLVSQRYSDFTEMMVKLLGYKQVGHYGRQIVAHIYGKIRKLEEEWDESIPYITYLTFKTDGTATEWPCEQLTGDKNIQPTLKQIAELAASVAAYDKWDKVLEVFREDAF